MTMRLTAKIENRDRDHDDKVHYCIGAVEFTRVGGTGQIEIVVYEKGRPVSGSIKVNHKDLKNGIDAL